MSDSSISISGEPQDEFGHLVVTLHVGSQFKRFLVHKNVICGIDYFEKAINREFEKTEDADMCLRDESPEVIGLFIHWLYRKKVPSVHSQLPVCLDTWYGLYIFGEKIAAEDLMDDDIDAIQDAVLFRDDYIDIAVLIAVYHATKATPELRKFATNLFVFQRWKNNQVRDLNDDPHPDSKPEVTEHTKNNKNDTPKRKVGVESPLFTWGETRELCTKLRDKDQLRADILSDGFHYSGKWNGSHPEDPRVQVDVIDESRCWCHCHKKDSSCRAVEVNNVPDWVDDTPADNALDSLDLRLGAFQEALARLFPIHDRYGPELQRLPPGLR